MNKKVLKTLEYEKILERLASKSTCPAGRDACMAIRPLDQKDDILHLLDETGDAIDRTIKYGHFSAAGAYDPSEYAPALEKGGTLTASELLRVAGLLSVVESALSYSSESKDPINDSLNHHFEDLTALETLRREITSAQLTG